MAIVMACDSWLPRTVAQRNLLTSSDVVGWPAASAAEVQPDDGVTDGSQNTSYPLASRSELGTHPTSSAPLRLAGATPVGGLGPTRSMIVDQLVVAAGLVEPL